LRPMLLPPSVAPLSGTTYRGMNVGTELKPCPFCGGAPSTVERPDNIDGTEFFYAVACYCGGYSACAHQMAKRKTPEQAKADAIAAWNRRAPHTMEMAK
jgi:Lar family restriction alleviation protein